tara:strand:+ start:59986 stop:60684 length:699 start_codon:yes stop_codon:yes gene_type:complete
MNVVKDSAYYQTHKLVVTRHQQGADDFIAALKGVNGAIEAIAQPVINIERLPCCIEPLDKDASIITTSKQADYALQRAGLRAHYGINSAKDINDVEALIHDIKSRHQVNRPLLYLRGLDISFDLSSELRAAGFTIDEKIVYRALPVLGLSEELVVGLKRGQIAYVTFFSVRSAQIFEQLINDAGLSAQLETIKALCLSEPVLNSLQDAPWKDRLISKDKTMASMTALVESLF